MTINSNSGTSEDVIKIQFSLHTEFNKLNYKNNYIIFRLLLPDFDVSSKPFSSHECQMALIDFTLSNARRFYSSMGNPLGWKGLRFLDGFVGTISLFEGLVTMKCSSSIFFKLSVAGFTMLNVSAKVTKS